MTYEVLSLNRPSLQRQCALANAVQTHARADRAGSGEGEHRPRARVPFSPTLGWKRAGEGGRRLEPHLHSKDEWIYRPHGKIQIWSRGDLWYVRWLPDEGNPGYPGHTYDSDKYGIPTDRGLDGVIVWATEQSWYEPATAD
jgi:hypothetical protein